MIDIQAQQSGSGRTMPPWHVVTWPLGLIAAVIGLATTSERWSQAAFAVCLLAAVVTPLLIRRVAALAATEIANSASEPVPTALAEASASAAGTAARQAALRASIIELRLHADAMTRSVSAAQEAMDRATAMAQASGARIQTGASAVAEIEVAIGDLATHVKESTDIFAELLEKAKRIGDIVSTINEIARQTNLLAMNAAIEASRAGQAGRGFAVVAHEVKALAARTDEASSQIGALAESLSTLCRTANKRVGDASRATQVGQARAVACQEVMRDIQSGAARRVAIVGEVIEALKQQRSLGEQIDKDAQLLAQNADAP